MDRLEDVAVAWILLVDVIMAVRHRQRLYTITLQPLWHRGRRNPYL
jgi:hypothetical protein